MSKKILLTTLALSVVFIFGTSPFSFSRANEIVVKGKAAYMDIGSGKLIDMRDEKKGQHELVISRNNTGEYMWASNGNKKLIKIEEKSDLRTEFTIFLNPDGYGAIVLRNMDNITCQTDILEMNYKEYIRKPLDWGYAMYSGFTTPYPYPVPINCEKN